jgi:hypothetical protein
MTMKVFLPGSAHAGPDGRLAGDVVGTITATMRGYVDGHQTSALLATRGSVATTWTLSGSGAVGDVPWTLEGSWTSESKLIDPAALGLQQEMQGTIWSKSFFAGATTLTGREEYRAGDVVETIDVKDLVGFVGACDMWEMTGAITNTLSSSEGVLSVTRTIPLPDFAAGSQTVQLTTSSYDGAAKEQTFTIGVPFRFRLPVAKQ